MKAIISIVCICFSLNAISQPIPILGDLPKSVFPDMKIIEKHKKRDLLIKQLHFELIKYRYSLPDIVFTVKEKKLSCYKDTYYYEFEAITNQITCMYVMTNKNDKYFLLEGFDFNEDYLTKEFGQPILSNEEQIMEYFYLFIGMQHTKSPGEFIASRYILVDNAEVEITKVQNTSFGGLTKPRFIGEIDNEFTIIACFSYDGAVYESIFTLSKDGEFNLKDGDLNLIGHYDYRDRFENGKIVIYNDLDFYQPVGKKLGRALGKEVRFAKMDYDSMEVPYYDVKNGIDFTLIDLSKLNWQETLKDSTPEQYYVDINFQVADTLHDDESFVFLALNANVSELLSPGNKSIKPAYRHIEVDENYFSLFFEKAECSQIETGKYTIRLFNKIVPKSPEYIVLSTFYAVNFDPNRMLRVLLDLRKQTVK